VKITLEGTPTVLI